MPTTPRPCATECINKEAHMPTETRSPLGMEHTLEALVEHGDITVSDNGHLATIDLYVRRSGALLYGTGISLDSAVADMWNELIDHIDAIDHLENLGIDALDIGRLTEEWRGEYDSELDPFFRPDPLSPAFTELPTPFDPVLATAGGPVVLSDETNMAIDKALDVAVETALDTTGAGYVLALLIPVREGRA